MASGYVIEVLNGNVNTLEEYANLCMKGLGATAHMAKEPLITEYRKAEPDKKNKKLAAKFKKQLKEFKLLTDKQLYKDELEALNTSRVHWVDKLVKVKAAKKKLTKLLKESQLWSPPTKKHIVVKEHMVKELKHSIDFDCDIQAIETLIQDVDGRLATIDVDLIRTNHIKTLEQQYDFHKQSYDLDVKHCEQSNEWCEELFKSFAK